jgi:hypothetical protein
VEVPFPLTTNEVKEFEIFLHDAPVGEATTLTVSVQDEAMADTRFQYSWEVRGPGGPVLYVPDNAGTFTKNFYRGFLDQEYGEGNFDEYAFWFGYPDNNFVLIQSIRKYPVVIWAGGGPVSQFLERAAETDGVLTQYLFPLDDSEPGKLFLVANNLVGNNSTLPRPFLKEALGLDPASSPVSSLDSESGMQALGLQPHLPAFTMTPNPGTGIGLQPWTNEVFAGESIYQLEFCQRCYSLRPPYDPVVGVRYPARHQQTYASVVTMSMQLELFEQSEAYAAMSALLAEEFGVAGK